MDIRNSFEQWAQGEGLPLATEGGRYREPRTGEAWRCWQAVVWTEREACAVVCDRRTARAEIRHDYDKGFEAAAGACAREIREIREIRERSGGDR